MNWCLYRALRKVDAALGTDELLRRSVPDWLLYLVDFRQKVLDRIERNYDTEDGDNGRLFPDES